MAFASTQTVTLPETVEGKKYEYYYYNGTYGHKREVLTGPSAHTTFQEIPIIDVSGIFSESFETRKEVALKVADACENIGFLLIKGHGVDQAVIDETYEMSKWYFDHDLEWKEQCGIYKNEGLRGYEGVYGARLDESLRKGDKKESFLYSYDPLADPTKPELTADYRSKLFTNQWPADAPKFKEALQNYQGQLLTLARALMRTFALGLGVEETYFDGIIKAPFNSIKIIKYPTQEPDNMSEIGIGAHTDFETFTILSQDQVGGLEVLNKNGHYIPATPTPGTFVVNVGDFLQRISNERFISTVHRVRNVTGQQRYSIPFFFAFDLDAYVKVLENCVSEDKPAKYEPLNVAEYTANLRKLQYGRFQKMLSQDA
ncbi:hypothetical protein BP6252_12079 [Coleophoma cylindrospora]|uniref:Fe2OG dioxygenase domain-containing protein n=1 Tax=Coleophoma cylindrospora TaxID=1849047 RepID=A0A3D8QFR5_9HELO|nr:hypothetical protein BP6252_12079 [Coleophoma cylindrospora]